MWRSGAAALRLPVRPWDLWLHGMLAVPVQIAATTVVAVAAAFPLGWLLGRPITREHLAGLAVTFPAYVGLGLVARGVHLRELVRARWLRAVLVTIAAVAWIPVPVLVMLPPALELPVATISWAMFAGMAAVVIVAGPRLRRRFVAGRPF
jgi:hypothetical protein